MRRLPVLASFTLLLSPIAYTVEDLQTAKTQPSADEDVALTSAVNDALIDSGIAKVGEIQVETHDGVVQLSGFVDSESTQQLALRATEKVEGVASVRNDLIVSNSTSGVSEAEDDTLIAARVRKQLQEHASVQSVRDINVEVNEGVVQLSGFVPSLEVKNRAADVVASVAGVKDVRNDIALGH